MVNNGPFSSLVKELHHNGTTYYYYDSCDLNEELYTKLPYSIRVLLEAAVRCCDNFEVKEEDVFKILNWEKTQFDNIEIPFKASRVILQDLTGVPALVDFAAMRDAISKLGGSPDKINPLCPTDLVIDHSVQVDYSRALLKDNKRIALNNKSELLCNDCQKIGKCSLESRFLNPSSQNDIANGFSKISLKNKIESWQPHSFDKLRQKSCPFHRLQSLGAESLEKNQQIEFTRNKERFYFLKWGAKAFKNMTIIPPGSGICHQVNLEYLARVVFIRDDNFLYPDSLVGADSHTTMINGLGIVGWGVGGIEAEAVMLGQAISMIIPQVVGYKLIGKLSSLATSTDLVLTITKHLRQVSVVGKFVEFFGPGVSELSIADRATIANMCPEYGATIAFFPVDEKALVYLNQTGRDENLIQVIKLYLEAVKLFRNYNDTTELKFREVHELDLATVTTSTSGPKRPHDRVAVTHMKYDFLSCLTNKIGFKGYGLSPDRVSDEVSFIFHGNEYVLRHGSVVISAITSCTNTSNPSVMLGAGLLAKKAVLKGLSVAPYIKTSMSPGSGVVTYYLRESGVIEYLEKLGFDVVGYGCMTCIGNSGSLSEAIVSAIEKKDLVVTGVLSGNRNFEGRVHPNTRANYLASPLLVIAYAIAGTIVIDFEKEPLGQDQNGQDVFLKDIWPSREEIQAVEEKYVIPAMFKEVYSKIECGNEQWNSLNVPDHRLFPWNRESTYIKSPPFFDKMTLELPKIESIKNAKVLVFFGDSVTTDHISPAGSIARSSKAAEYLMSRGIEPIDFNSYGSRRGNDEVMARATFANIRLVNKLASKTGPKTLHIPSNEEMFIFEAASKYKLVGTPLIIIAGRDYGSGSSRDWAAKGPFLLGIKAVIVESYERIHRSNLIGMGLLPLQFLEGQNAATLGLNGKETYSIEVPQNLTPRQKLKVEVNDNGKTITFEVIVRIDTAVELQYFKNGGILQYMLRRIVKES